MSLIDILSLNMEYFAWDGIVQWRDRLYQCDLYHHTRANYFTGMLKLIEVDIVNVKDKLGIIDDNWFSQKKREIDDVNTWSPSTKSVRKSCLKSFYSFIQTEFDSTVTPYQRHPDPNEIKHLLSSTRDKVLIKNISTIELCEALSKINERDAYIVWLIMWTGETLEDILNLRIKEDYTPPYMRFTVLGKEDPKYIPEHIIKALDELSKNSKTYLFETSSGKKVCRTQITRNLKEVGHRLGLNFCLTPSLLQSHVCEDMSRDKRSILAKSLGI